MMFVANLALAQTFDVQNLVVHGTQNTIGVATFQIPIPIASGGTNAASASGTALDNISGFASTGFLTRTGAGAYSFQSLTNGITLGNLAQAAANTVLANATSATASVAAFSMPGCSATTNALTWTTSTGFTCNSAINAATLGGATFAAPGPIGATTPSTGSFTTLAASGTVSGTGFTNYFASPPPIGSTTANTGKFTTLGANSSSVAFTFTSPGGVPTVGGVGAIAGTATLGQVNDGSTGSPHTALTPSVAITRNEAINSASLSGNSPALWVEVVGNNSGAGNPNSNALEAVATQNGTGDAVGIVGWAIQQGTSGHYSYGGFFNAQTSSANSNAFAIETVTTNATGTNQPLVVGNVPPMVGLHIDAGSNNTSTSALWVSKDTGAGSGRWDSGLYFSPSSIVTYGVIDESSSVNSFFVGGSHTNGLNLANGTFSGSAIVSPGFSVNGVGTINSSPSPTVGWGHDFTGANVVIGNGGNSVMAPGNGLILVHESVNNQDAIYLCSAASCNLVSTIGSTWVSPTTTPAAGKLSVNWNGSTGYAVYNNQGASETVNVGSFRVNNGN